MKINLTHIIVIILLSGFCYSCKKEAKPKDPVYSKELSRTAIVKTAELRMYTNNRQITDTTIINNYIKPYIKYFNFDKKPYETEYKMTFLGPDSASFFTGTNPYNFVSIGNKYIFKSIRSVTRPFNMPLYLNIFKYNEPYIPNGTSGLQTTYRTQDVRIGNGNAIAMELPVLCFKFSSRIVGSSYFISGGFAFNEFDETVIPKLGPNDTLAVQLFKYNMKAQIIE